MDPGHSTRPAPSTHTARQKVSATIPRTAPSHLKAEPGHRTPGHRGGSQLWLRVQSGSTNTPSQSAQA